MSAIIVHPLFPPPPVYRAAELDDIPFDVLHVIASFLPTARDLCAFEGVCRSTRAAAADDNLWRALCARAFPGALAAPPAPGGAVTWRDLYRFNHRFLYQVLVGKRPRGGGEASGPRLVALGRDAFYVALPARVFAR